LFEVTANDRAATLQAIFTDGETTSVGTRSSSRQRASDSNQAKWKGTEGREIMADESIAAAFALQSKTAHRNVVAAPHHSFEKSWASDVCFVFIVLHFSIFLFENHHHSITEFGPHFMRFFFLDAFFSIYLSLIMKENRYSALEAWIRAKKITECCIGLALSAFLSIFSVFVARHVQGKHGGLWVVSWFLSWVCLFLQPTLFSNPD